MLILPLSVESHFKPWRTCRASRPNSVSQVFLRSKLWLSYLSPMNPVGISTTRRKVKNWNGGDQLEIRTERDNEIDTWRQKMETKNRDKKWRQKMLMREKMLQYVFLGFSLHEKPVRYLTDIDWQAVSDSLAFISVICQWIPSSTRKSALRKKMWKKPTKT